MLKQSTTFGPFMGHPRLLVLIARGTRQHNIRDVIRATAYYRDDMVNVVLIKFAATPITLTFLPLILLLDVLRSVRATIALHASIAPMRLYTMHHSPMFSMKVPSMGCSALLDMLEARLSTALIYQLSMGIAVLPLLLSSLFTMFSAILSIIGYLFFPMYENILQAILLVFFSMRIAVQFSTRSTFRIKAIFLAFIARKELGSGGECLQAFRALLARGILGYHGHDKGHSLSGSGCFSNAERLHVLPLHYTITPLDKQLQGVI
jgi:hypothetical protein